MVRRTNYSLQTFALVIAALWIAAQIALIAYYWGYPQRSDMAMYISYAQRCFANGEWYPMMEDIYSDSICAQGFINFLILQLRIFGTINFNAVINLFLNIAMLLEIYYLGKKFFSERVGLISAVIFCLLPSNLFIVLGANTENTFLFLCLSALCLVFSNNLKYIVVASILFALANWIRPLAIIFIFSSAVYFAITKTKVYNYIALVIPCLLMILAIGAMTEKKIGYFVYQSTTAGGNLLISAHDRPKGSFYYFDKKYGENDIYFIENIQQRTFAERDSIYLARSLAWIKKHPVKFATLFFMKIPILYLNDSWSGMSHFEPSTHTANALHGDASLKGTAVKKILKILLQSATYYLAFLLFFYAIYIHRKEILTVKSIFLLILLSGTIITCIVVAVPRYHYPFLFPVIIYAAWGIDALAGRLTAKKSEQRT